MLLWPQELFLDDVNKGFNFSAKLKIDEKRKQRMVLDGWQRKSDHREGAERHKLHCCP